MPRPDWLQMSSACWYDQDEQDALFDLVSSGSDVDDFGTVPFDGCTAEELNPSGWPIPSP
ncbi:hypothetical protein ACIQ9P_04235 [Kitasatospora sp. NPDC094019]|uniref:hypothetical protein n=1 Tax=Kitasatospora sp. NPDC094019 TaxID=3364091 RepID=UPI0037FA5ABD